MSFGKRIGGKTKKIERKTINIFIPINFNTCLGALMNHLIETVLLGTYNI